MTDEIRAALDRLVPALDGHTWPAPVTDRVVLVTGAAGSIGRGVTRRCLDAGAAKVVLIDIDENGLYLFGRSLERGGAGSRVAIELANVREFSRLEALFAQHRPDAVIHAAAHKHVPLLETAPSEAVRNNVFATAHVCRLAHRAGSSFVFVSTDKAVAPTSVLGQTKRIAEQLVWSYAPARHHVARLGNVVGSAGSVVPLFLEQIAAGGPLTVTHRDARRYFCRSADAAALVVAGLDPTFAPLVVLDPGAPLSIMRLAETLIAAAHGATRPEIIAIGLRPGEKIDETLLNEAEAAHAQRIAPHIVRVRPVPTAFDRDAVLAELEAAVRTEQADTIRACLDYAIELPATRDTSPVADP